MAGIVRRPYRGWDEFFAALGPELFTGDRFRDGRYLFRGVGDADWELVSSFDRQFPAVADRQGVSQLLLDEFRAGCADLADHDLLTDGKRLLAFGQHHGLPTRLLDWTVSPYIAAFFALSSTVIARPGPRRFVSVWALHLDAPIWNTDDGVAIVEQLASGNARLRHQAGCFTLALGSFRSLEEYAAEAPYDGPALTQLSIPTTDADRGLAHLQMMGITAARLFPDADGAAKTAMLRVRLALDDSPSPKTRAARAG